MPTENLDKDLYDLWDRFKNGAPKDFAGLMIFIPPSGEARKLELTSSHPDPKFFWAQAINYLNVILTEQEESERNRPGGFR